MAGSTGSATADQGEMRAQATGSDETGSHVIWKEKPLASVKKGSWAQGEVKPQRNRGRKVQSPIFGMGGDP